jgi:hypothetical protein
MLQLTPAARAHLLRVRAERGVAPNVPGRIEGNGVVIGFTFQSKPDPRDHVLHGAGQPLYVAAEIAPIMDQVILDAREELGGTVLVARLQPGAPFHAKRPD